MLAEFALGKGTNSDAIGAFQKLRPGTPWWLTGALGILASYVILCFYMVVAGWTLEYLWQSVTGNLFDLSSSALSAGQMDHAFHHKMEEYINTDAAPLICTFILIAVNLCVLLGGVQKGIERMSSWAMPLLFVILLLFCVVSLSLPGAIGGVEFFLAPDFSKITPTVMVNALGQAFFSLSLGMGALITYGSYFPKDTKLVNTAITVSMLDMLVAILMGFIIFPAVFSFGLDGAELRGTTLVFVTLPEVFAQMPASQLWSTLFFLLLLVAAVTSTISMAEVSIKFIQDRFKRSRRTACFIVMLPLFLFSALCSLSFGSLSSIQLCGMNIFNFLDTVSTNYMLPIGAFFICIFTGWVVPKDYFRKELIPLGGHDRPVYSLMITMVRYVSPILIVLVMLSSIGLF